MSGGYLDLDISAATWDMKYRYRDDGMRDRSIVDTWRRVARALATPEGERREEWELRFYRLLEDFRFLPGGRILAGAGTRRQVTLFNCFVMGVLEDSLDGIFEALKEGARTMQQGGGVGYDFSTLRPAGSPAQHSGTIASGPVSFMRIWDSMCATLLSTGARRGAMMATLRCDHPDIETFITAKRQAGELRHFNLSVQVSDAFMEAVHRDDVWPLVFPESAFGPSRGEVVMRSWPGARGEVPCRVMRRVGARVLWEKITRATYEYAEPGVLFIDRVNRENNLYYRETISATNPCGEIPLPPYGACDLGSVNLTRFVCDPFTPQARFDFEAIDRTVADAVRLMDNVIDVSQFPLPAQAEQARGSRRIGLGLTGLADALVLLGLHYGSEAGRRTAAQVMERIAHGAYRSSIALALEKGAFPFYEPAPYLQAPFIRRLPSDIREGIARTGIRNGLLTAIAPTGTISLLADNVSSGLEPIFDFRYRRRMIDIEGNYREYELTDYAWRLWRRLHGNAPLPPTFVQARALLPDEHLQMQAALQPFVDNAISKTINVPADFPFDAFKAVYERAYEQGLKGCTTFRPNPVTGAVLESVGAAAPCCGVDGEPD